VEFDASADHAVVSPVSGANLVDGYRMRLWPAASCTGTTAATCSGTPAFTLQFNKPAPVSGKITVLDIFGGLVLNSLYKGVVDAYGPGGATASTVVGPFGRENLAAPRAPASPALLPASPTSRVSSPSSGTPPIE